MAAQPQPDGRPARRRRSRDHRAAQRTRRDAGEHGRGRVRGRHRGAPDHRQSCRGADCSAIDVDDVHGRALHEVIRTPGLQAFVAATLASDEPVEDDIVLRTGARRSATRYLQANGSPLRGADGGRSAPSIVLNDVTRLRRLETVRRDFIANVSHELRTPVTSIKGFAETLLDGAIDDRRRRRALPADHRQPGRAAQRDRRRPAQHLPARARRRGRRGLARGRRRWPT